MISSIGPTENKGLADLAKAVREMREGADLRNQLLQIFAKDTRVKYLALVDEGFTPEQALILCK